MSKFNLADRLQSGLRPDDDHLTVRRKAAGVVKRYVGYDVAAIATVDPSTYLATSCLLDGVSSSQLLRQELFVNEFCEPDYNKLRDLARTRVKAGSIRQATGQDPMRSTRFRRLLAPRGIADEARVVLHDGNHCWGSMTLYRTGGQFTVADIEAIAVLSRPLGAVLRQSLPTAYPPSAAGDQAPAPGIVRCDRSGGIVDINAEAASLFTRAGFPEFPYAVSALVALRMGGGPAVTAVPTPSGGWLSLRATSLDGGVAVIVEQVQAPQLADILLMARGVTTREREIVGHLVRGATSRQISRQLQLSEWTVNAHLKSIFGKFRVGSRQELTAALLFGYHTPQPGSQRSALDNYLIL